MLSSKTLNQNMLKMPYFLKKIAKLWGLRPHIPASYPHRLYCYKTLWFCRPYI